MTISPAQVKDLQPGDVVRIRSYNWPEGTSITGPAYRDPGRGTLKRLEVGGHPIETMAACGTLAEFEIVSRAPRPLYVNHQRAWAMKGDVARSAECDNPYLVWGYDGTRWYLIDTRTLAQPDFNPGPLRLLVDGETGQAVTS